PKKYVLKLRRSLYGLKQAPRIWWDRMTSFLLKAGFYQCDAEPAIFICSLDNKFLILLLFVDDILLTVILHQKAYIQRILERFNAPTNPVATPLDPKHPLIEATNAESLNETDALEYRAAVGELIYLMICTRPDLAFALSRLSKFMQKPGIKHAAALKRVLRLATASYEVIWLRKLILAILPQYAEHTMPSNTIHCDNQGAIAIANQPSHSPSTRSKHIDIRFHVIREAIANGLIRLEYIRTTEITADILTKALPKELHEYH
ncbi:hypothetical protein TSTA_022970, partial [Talaromyces stipitatus ATCC 10500]